MICIPFAGVNSIKYNMDNVVHHRQSVGLLGLLFDGGGVIRTSYPWPIVIPQTYSEAHCTKRIVVHSRAADCVYIHMGGRVVA